MSDYRRYHKKTKKDRRRRTKRFNLAVGIVTAAAVAAVVFGFAWHSYRQKQNEVGYEDASADSSQSGGAITYNGQKYVPNDHLSNYLFIGVDSSTSLSDSVVTRPSYGGQADAIYLLSYDRVKKTRKTFAIPRDSMTDIEVFSLDGNSLGFSKDHLSLQYAYGDGKAKSCQLMATAVSKLFLGQKIVGYTAVNLESIPHLTELVDYVDVTVPNDSLASVNPNWKKGSVAHLTANNTEQFVRYRDTNVSQSALTRMDRQIAFATAFEDRVKALQSEDSSTVSDIYDGLKSYMVTNMDADDFLNLEQARASGKMTTIPGKGTTGDIYDEYHIDQNKLYDLIVRNFYKKA